MKNDTTTPASGESGNNTRFSTDAFGNRHHHLSGVIDVAQQPTPMGARRKLSAKQERDVADA